MKKSMFQIIFALHPPQTGLGKAFSTGGTSGSSRIVGRGAMRVAGPVVAEVIDHGHPKVRE